MTTIDKAILPPKLELTEHGFIKFHLPFPSEFKEVVNTCNWEVVDQLIFKYLSKGELLHSVITHYQVFNFSEHIIAIRDAATDEDGIWHDDGSREIAFTWSLNDDDQLEGGELLFRSKSNSSQLESISPPPRETLIIFLTGKSGFEHKVNQVTKGRRKTIAGWCSLEKPEWES